MKTIISLILLLGCVVHIPPLPALGQRLKAVPVVEKFGGECQGTAFHPSPRLERLIQKTKQREVSPCNWPFCGGAFAYDLNGDSWSEYFVRLGCGATGNCIWGIFSDRPARLRGTFTAWFFYIHRRAGGWSALSTYTREGGDRGIIATLANRKGIYIQTSERTEQGYYGKSAAVPQAHGYAEVRSFGALILKGSSGRVMPGVIPLPMYATTKLERWETPIAGAHDLRTVSILDDGELLITVSEPSNDDRYRLRFRFAARKYPAYRVTNEMDGCQLLDGAN